MATLVELEAQVAALKAVVQKAERTPVTDVKKAFGTPAIREGEDPMSSRPFYVHRAAKALVKGGNRDNAKFEVDFSEKLRKALTDHDRANAQAYGDTSILVPLSWAHMPEDIQRDNDFLPYRKAFAAAVQDLDPDMVNGKTMVENFSAGQRGVIKKAALSYINQQTGGALVAPPEFMDLIQILRNKAVMQNINARQVPLPAQGAVKFPRQTGVSTAYNVPENTAGTESNPTFDDITMEPKQYITLVRASNQLLTFSPGLAEAAIREDIGEQMTLTFDLDCLEGKGGPNKVLGIINQPGISTVVAKVVGANGNTWSPADTARIIKACMAKNSDVKSFIMRPDMWLGITETRADSVLVGDKAGNYLYEMMRQFSTDFGTNLRQRDVVTSNQVSPVRTKGTSSSLTYILGLDGQEIMVGMHGAMALDANPWEGTAYSKNQTLMRAIMFGDLAIRRPAGVAFMDSLLVPNLDT